MELEHRLTFMMFCVSVFSWVLSCELRVAHNVQCFIHHACRFHGNAEDKTNFTPTHRIEFEMKMKLGYDSQEKSLQVKNLF